MILPHVYLHRLLTLVTILLLFAFDVSAYELDKSFNPNITEPFSDEKRINVIVEQADGKVLIGGHFRAVDGVSRSSVARLCLSCNVSLDTLSVPAVLDLLLEE